jgi:nicotinate-nucleotide pyrophosphorylase (carboxylating)
MSTPALPPDIADVVSRALAEDLGPGDITAALLGARLQAAAELRLRETAVLCGSAWFDEVFRQIDPAVTTRWAYADSSEAPADAVVCTLRGPARALLSGERTALNLLQTLSGTATAAHRYTQAVAGTGARILDTRKTLPGLRSAQKYAVRCGGAVNHRSGLYDAVLIKENHIAAMGGIEAAVRAARESQPAVLIEIEVESLEELDAALRTDADRLLLDNFALPDLRAAVTERDAHGGKRKELEASGGIELQGIRAVAETGVDFISVGAITKHLRAVDFSMRFIAA